MNASQDIKCFAKFKLMLSVNNKKSKNRNKFEFK